MQARHLRGEEAEAAEQRLLFERLTEADADASADDADGEDADSDPGLSPSPSTTSNLSLRPSPTPFNPASEEGGETGGSDSGPEPEPEPKPDPAPAPEPEPAAAAAAAAAAAVGGAAAAAEAERSTVDAAASEGVTREPEARGLVSGRCGLGCSTGDNGATGAERRPGRRLDELIGRRAAPVESCVEEPRVAAGWLCLRASGGPLPVGAEGALPPSAARPRACVLPPPRPSCVLPLAELWRRR